MRERYCCYCMKPSPEDICPHCGRRGSEYVPAPHQLPPGTVLNGKYALGAVLGEGGFGITYIGRDITLDMPVAIKEYFPSGMVNRNATASVEITARPGEAQSFFEKGKTRFLEEARMLAKFSNDAHVVSVRDFFEDHNTAYIVMEYLDGVDLKEHLARYGVMDFSEAVRVFDPLMTALSKIHAQGLIHRDISPANIMIMADGRAKLLDFGAARNVGGADEKSLSIMLKPGYAPEEQYRSKGHQGPWTDVYALSATLYKLVTGVTPPDAMNRIYQDELVAPSSLNPSLTPEQDKVLLKGMAVRMEDRYSSIEELQRACQAALAGSGAVPAEAAGDATVAVLQPPVDEVTVMAPRDGGDEATAVQTAVDQSEGNPPVVPVSRGWGLGKGEGQGKKRADASDAQDQATQRPETGKKPNRLGLVLSTLTGLLFLRVFLDLAVVLGSSDAPPVTILVILAVLLVLGGATFLLGWLYYPRVNNKARKPNIPCLVGSVLAILAALIWGAIVMDVRNSYEEGVVALSAAVFLALLVIAGFFGYFFYPRLSKRGRGLAVKIHGGILAGVVILLIGRVVFTSLSTITVGDTVIPRDATEVSISTDIITNRDLGKLKELKKLESLSITTCFLDDEDVRILGELTQLQRLFLFNNEDITDVSPLKNLKNLVKLDISMTKAEDITCLGNLTKLEELKISGTMVKDLRVLGNFTALEHLSMNGLSQLDISTLQLPPSVKYLYCSESGLENLDFLSGLDDLYVILAEGNQISDLTPLQKMKHLETVNFSKNQVTDISPLGPSVTSIQCDQNMISDISCLAGRPVYRLELAGNQVSDISALADNTKLTILDLSANQVTDISPLKECFHLSSLDLSNNDIVDISALATVDDLDILNLKGNKIVDISPLAQVQGFVEKTNSLDLRDNQIESVQPLSAFKDLRRLNMSGNRVADISPLTSCSKLEWVALNRNNISDLAPLLSMEKLNHLEVVSNPIKDLSAVPVTLRDGRDQKLFLHVTYDADINWQELYDVEGLAVFVFDTPERAKADMRGSVLAQGKWEEELETDEGEDPAPSEEPGEAPSGEPGTEVDG